MGRLLCFPRTTRGSIGAAAGATCRAGMYRAFVPEAAYKTSSCGAKCFLCCNELEEPRPEDYDKNGVAYIHPPLAEPIYRASVLEGRPARVGCCGTAVPDNADRARMYPRCYESLHPSRQTMESHDSVN